MSVFGSEREGFLPSLQIFFTQNEPDESLPSLRRSSACPCCCSSTASARDAPCHCCVRVHVRCAWCSHKVGKVSSLRARTKVDSIPGNHEQAPRIKDTVSTTHESSHNDIDHLCDNAPLPGCEPPHPSEQGADARSADLVQRRDIHGHISCRSTSITVLSVCVLE